MIISLDSTFFKVLVIYTFKGFYEKQYVYKLILQDTPKGLGLNLKWKYRFVPLNNFPIFRCLCFHWAALTIYISKETMLNCLYCSIW